MTRKPTRRHLNRRLNDLEAGDGALRQRETKVYARVDFNAFPGIDADSLSLDGSTGVLSLDGDTDLADVAGTDARVRGWSDPDSGNGDE